MQLVYRRFVSPEPPFHTAGATGSIPVPPTIRNKSFQSFPQADSLEFGTIWGTQARREALFRRPRRLDAAVDAYASMSHIDAYEDYSDHRRRPASQGPGIKRPTGKDRRTACRAAGSDRARECAQIGRAGWN